MISMPFDVNSLLFCAIARVWDTDKDLTLSDKYSMLILIT
jgi:hypothetical protein